MLNLVAKKWVAALRSGKYEQGTGQLRNGDTYCCLGVLCDVALKEGVLDIFPQTAGTLINVPVVQKWSKLSNSWGGYSKKGSLVDDNDANKTFSQIADIIESEPEGLFIN